MEIHNDWKIIEEAPDYEIHPTGKVRIKSTKRQRPQRIKRKNHRTVYLYINGIRRELSVNKLLSIYFTKESINDPIYNSYFSYQFSNMDNEIWKDVVGYEGFYKVSNFGRVASLPRIVKTKKGKGTKNLTETRLLSPSCKVNNEGYLKITLHNENVAKCCLAHRLVAEAFLPNPLNYPIVHHKNGIRNDNRLENLQWCTYEFNNQKKNTVINRFEIKNYLLNYIEENNIRNLGELLKSLS